MSIRENSPNAIIDCTLFHFYEARGSRWRSKKCRLHCSHCITRIAEELEERGTKSKHFSCHHCQCDIPGCHRYRRRTRCSLNTPPWNEEKVQHDIPHCSDSHYLGRRTLMFGHRHNDAYGSHEGVDGLPCEQDQEGRLSSSKLRTEHVQYSGSRQDDSQA